MNAASITPRESPPIHWKVPGIIFVFVLTVAGMLRSPFAVLESRKSDALVMDLAGRHVLHPRHRKEILLAADQHPIDIRRRRSC